MRFQMGKVGTSFHLPRSTAVRMLHYLLFSEAILVRNQSFRAVPTSLILFFSLPCAVYCAMQFGMQR